MFFSLQALFFFIIWSRSFNPLFGRTRTPPSVDKPVDCHIIHNRHAVQSMGRLMICTLEDNMVDDFFFCHTHMRTMFLSGSNRRRLQCHTVSYSAVRLRNTAPPFFLAGKLCSMSCVSKVIWSRVDFPYRTPACSSEIFESMIGSTRAEVSLSSIWKGTRSRDIGL